MVELSASMRVCMTLKRGKPFLIKKVSASSISGMDTASTSANRALSDMAMISAPISMPGARSVMRRSILTKFCSCVTSLVMRVTSEPVWK